LRSSTSPIIAVIDIANHYGHRHRQSLRSSTSPIITVIDIANHYGHRHRQSLRSSTSPIITVRTDEFGPVAASVVTDPSK
jgi:hypothetical protein